MPKLEKLLTIHSRKTASPYTVRKLIAFKTGRSYRRCLKYMTSKGMRPFKRIPGSRLIGCHMDSRFSIKKLLSYKTIKLIERDKKTKVHASLRPHSSKKKSKPFLAASASNGNGNGTSDPAWNFFAIQAPQVWKRTLGSGIKLAIIDTGIAPHPNLRIAGGINTINGGSYADDNGHGTHVAGIAAGTGKKGFQGVAPKVNLYAVKALDSSGAGYVSDIIDGIEWCIRNNMDIINMSFGLESGDSSETLRNSIKKAVGKGIVVIASAGNSGPNNGALDEPAAFPETISVAATTKTNRIANFSSRGEGIVISAPGDSIRSTWMNGAFFTVSGTSMACPHVAGGVALLLALKPNLSPSEIKSLLKKNAMNLSDIPRTAQGSGLLQLGFL
ncbi:S8 family peptidase [Paenibacillus sp. NEAU-GSW1]|uniref:S8 family peptidase n=1 Tax=Paenibacillus sp. NEAU-GSW1 TaxID=2682486 RepID=UPI0012E16FA0|nr:S8 family peptidase [Paenibacillus sp. NEAU-GSW1]MUT65554.1 S8 family serine peptidase [Paenibacillus sp. NEAU-GSW1]